MRSASVERNTKETQISGTLKIEGRGRYEISTGIRFFDHMLELFTKARRLRSEAEGQGRSRCRSAPHRGRRRHRAGPACSRKPWATGKGINRAGYFVLPMDETLAVVAVDLGGRPALVYKDQVKVRLVGDLQTELVRGFLRRFRQSRRRESSRQSACMAVRIITRSRQFSNASRAPCAMRARTTRG